MRISKNNHPPDPFPIIFGDVPPAQRWPQTIPLLGTGFQRRIRVSNWNSVVWMKEIQHKPAPEPPRP